MPQFDSRKTHVLDLEEWRKEGGHACVKYADAQIRERQDHSKRYEDALANLTSGKLRKTEEPGQSVDTNDLPGVSRVKGLRRASQPRRVSNQQIAVVIIAVIAVILLIKYGPTLSELATAPSQTHVVSATSNMIVSTPDNCSLIIVFGSQQGLSEQQSFRVQCMSRCGQQGGEYVDYQCNADSLVCECRRSQ